MKTCNSFYHHSSNPIKNKKILIISILSAIIVFFIGFYFVSQATINNKIKDAENYFKNKNYEKAAAIYIELLDKNYKDKQKIYKGLSAVRIAQYEKKNGKALKSLSADGNGDGILENIILFHTGSKDQSNNNPSSNVEITLFIQDILSGKIVETFADDIWLWYEVDNTGPDLFIGDVSGDHIADIMLSQHIGGRTGSNNHAIYSFQNSKYINIYNYNDMEMDLDYEYLDQYKLNIFSKNTNQSATISLSEDQKNGYTLLGYYSEIGKVRDKHFGFSYDNGLIPVDTNKDGTYELVYEAIIDGERYNEDPVASIKATYQYKNNAFICTDLKAKQISPKRQKSKVDKSMLPSLTKNKLDLLYKGMCNATPIAIGSSVNQVFEIYGEPMATDEWQGAYYKVYEDFVFYDDGDTICGIDFGKGTSIYGIKVGMSPAEIEKILGKPDDEWIDQEESIIDENNIEKELKVISYIRGDHTLYFEYTDDKNSPTISAMIR